MKSWVKSANLSDSHFPIQNLPFGVARLVDGSIVCVSAIGDYIINLAQLEQANLLRVECEHSVFNQPNLNEFMALGSTEWKSVRAQLTSLFSDGADSHAFQELQVLEHSENVEMQMPFRVSEYTDFYAGEQHARNTGQMLRGMDELPVNWLHIPIGYNGRASSVVVSGTNLHRPVGQIKLSDQDMPTFGPSQKMDIELELGAVVGTESKLGESLSTEQADDMIFGYVLLNDWSARDIQAWEYQPLGPFQGKIFGTTIGAWVISKEALEPFRAPVPARKKKNLPYLIESKPGLYDIHLEISLQPESAATATTISRTNYNRMYYSSVQQLTHHAIGGCKMNTGDLLGSGTISGPHPSEYGSMFEMSWNGSREIIMETGETRTFIEDNDRLTLTGWAQGNGYKIGFGECTGKILSAIL